MPVRIYDIAKKLGIESKDVLAKAKELGISGARVPSSSLDKITAEYLEEQLGGKPVPPPEPAPASAPEPAPAPVAPPPPAPVAVAAVPAAGAPAPEPLPPAPEPAVATAPVPPAPEAPPAPAPEVVPPVTQAPVAITPTPVQLPPVDPPAPMAVAEPPVTPPPPPPPPPAAPAAPRLGEKVGWIQLPQRPAPRAPFTKTVTPPRAAAPQPPSRVGGKPGERDARSAPAAPAAPKFVTPTTGETITIKPPIVVRELAEHLKKKPFQVIGDLMALGVFAMVNQTIDEQVARQLCAKYGYRFEVEKRDRGGGHHAPTPVTVKPVDTDIDPPETLKPRAPVVTIMGHVDHGKTTLLDVIRKSNVAAKEAGGITQHIGAYTISIPHPDPARKKELQQITFLDTPGHAAFSAMRARGANVTDLVILVVASNDGVMPQTLEALSHATAAKVPIIVAVSKSDHPNANPMRVRQQLQDKGLVDEQWGGSTIFVDVSALTRQGVDKLLEMLVLQADMMELKANPNRSARGNVIESGREAGGPTATVLIRRGTLRVGDTVVCGPYWGRIRALISEEGNRLKEAGPSVAVRILGLDGVPEAGVEFSVFEDEKDARALAEERRQAARENNMRDIGDRPRLTIEDVLRNTNSGDAKVLRVIIKGDTQGSVEAITEALMKTESPKVSLEILHGAVGTVTESDVLLASASKAVILGFHTRVDTGVPETAKREGVQIKLYAIIYELIDEVKDAMAGLLDPIIREAVIGQAEVRKVFELSKGGKVAGCVVNSGRVSKGKVRLVRRKNVIFEGIVHSLRRFQDEVNEVRAGMECGIRIDGFQDFQIGDYIESYQIEKVPQKL